MASEQASRTHPYLVHRLCTSGAKADTIGLCACSLLLLLLLLRKNFMACKKPNDEHLDVFQFDLVPIKDLRWQLGLC